MNELVPFIFLGVVLKIPVFLAMWLIWKAMTAVPDNPWDEDGGAEEPLAPKPKPTLQKDSPLPPETHRKIPAPEPSRPLASQSF